VFLVGISYIRCTYCLVVPASAGTCTIHERFFWDIQRTKHDPLYSYYTKEEEDKRKKRCGGGGSHFFLIFQENVGIAVFEEQREQLVDSFTRTRIHTSISLSVPPLKINISFNKQIHRWLKWLSYRRRRMMIVLSMMAGKRIGGSDTILKYDRTEDDKSLT